MAKVIIENEEYPLDLSYFTNRELHMIKKETGIRAGELYSSFDAGDTDLLVALAMIAVRRAGKPVESDELWDLPAGKITLDVTDEEADASPPDETPSASSDVGGLSSSDSSVNGDANPEASNQNDSGNPGSATGAISALEISAT